MPLVESNPTQHVPGVAVMMQASAASPYGLFSTSGISRKPDTRSWCRAPRIMAATAALKRTISTNTIRHSRAIATGRRSPPPGERNAVMIHVPPNAMIAPSNTWSRDNVWLSSIHIASRQQNNNGNGSQRFTNSPHWSSCDLVGLPEHREHNYLVHKLIAQYSSCSSSQVRLGW